jgi:hypothetical protein
VSNAAESRIHAIVGDEQPLEAEDPDALSLGLFDELFGHIDIGERVATAAHDSIGTLTGSLEQVHVLWESEVQHAGQDDRTTMKRHRHTPEQIVRKLGEG